MRGCGVMSESLYLYQCWLRRFDPARHETAICAESYIGNEGVKLEDQVFITNDDVKVLSKIPSENNLML